MGSDAVIRPFVVGLARRVEGSGWLAFVRPATTASATGPRRTRRASPIWRAAVLVCATHATARVSGAQSALGTADTLAVPRAASAPRVDAATRPHLFLPGEVRTFGVFALGAAAVAPFDARITRWAQRPTLHRGGALPRSMDAFRFAGNPGTVFLTGGAYVLGRVTHRPELADVGLHVGEAVVVSVAATEVLKLVVGRARPYTVGDRSATVFRPGRGTAEGYASFPSGHVTAAFATAAAAAAELTRPEIAAEHPTSARLVPPLAYGAAALVGVSRVYQDQHWTSDAVVGAAIGTVIGRALVRFQHGRPPDRLQRWLLPHSLTPTRTGLLVGWHFSQR